MQATISSAPAHACPVTDIGCAETVGGQERPDLVQLISQFIDVHVRALAIMALLEHFGESVAQQLSSAIQHLLSVFRCPSVRQVYIQDLKLRG